MIRVTLPVIGCTGLAILTGVSFAADDPHQSNSDFANYAAKLRKSAILRLESEKAIPTAARSLNVSGRYPWKTGIVTTVFWIGSAPGKSDGNQASAWDPQWGKNFGGFDDPNPKRRRNFVPVAFTPRLNPFYVALPYNDLARSVTKPEAKVVIPWFKSAFVAEGVTVCRDRWVAIRNADGKVCYAQWSDCGPFHTDHWQYVFGNEKPRSNANQGAGLNVSPAVRDFLGLDSTDVSDWKFADFRDVPRGPWALHGENNHFVQARASQEQSKKEAPLAPPAPSPTVEPNLVK